MSRIGRMPIAIPAGVTVTVGNENVVTVSGKLGTLTEQFSSLHGLTRALLFNMVEGVTNGYSKKLEIVGVGYKVIKQGKTLQLFLGHSLMPNSGLPQARFCMTEEDGITFEVPDSNTIIVKGIDKQKVGQVAAVIRSKRPPEPSPGKGVKYSNEVVRRKAGKAGKGK